MRLFSGSDVVRAVGMNQKVLTQWIDRGLIIPAKKAAGSGDKNGFTLLDIIRVGMMKQLADFGLSRGEAARIAFYPEGNPAGDVLSQIINRVLHSCRQAQKARKEGLGWGAAVAEPCLVVFFKGADGNYNETECSTLKDLRVLFNNPYETATIIHLTRLVQRVIEALGAE